MPRPKKIEVIEEEVSLTTGETVVVPIKEDSRAKLRAFLLKRLPSMFDRDPVITGNVDLLVADIISLLE